MNFRNHTIIKMFKTQISTRFCVLICLLELSILAFIIKSNIQKEPLSIPLTGTYYTPQCYFLNKFILEKKMQAALFDADEKEAFTVVLHYYLGRMNIDGLIGDQWCFIATKLGSQKASMHWKQRHLAMKEVFNLPLNKQKGLPDTPYGHYIRYIAAMLRNDDAEAAAHLNRLRELGVTEKLLENPLVLPGMEDAP